MKIELTASMMCANYGNLEKEVRELEEGGIDSFHIDIMDGRYVPNFAMSLNDMAYIASATKKPLDVHLMLEHPNNNIHIFLKRLRKVIRCTFILKRNITLLPPCRKLSMPECSRELPSTREPVWKPYTKCSAL